MKAAENEPQTLSTQTLQKAYDEILNLEEKVKVSKWRFERELQMQSILNADLAKQLAAKTDPIHLQLAASASLINSIPDENALWAEASRIANLSHKAEDPQFATALRESERLVRTAMQQNVDKDHVANAIDDLIRTLQAT